MSASKAKAKLAGPPPSKAAQASFAAFFSKPAGAGTKAPAAASVTVAAPPAAESAPAAPTTAAPSSSPVDLTLPSPSPPPAPAAAPAAAAPAASTASPAATPTKSKKPTASKRKAARASPAVPAAESAEATSAAAEGESTPASDATPAPVKAETAAEPATTPAEATASSVKPAAAASPKPAAAKPAAAAAASKKPASKPAAKGKAAAAVKNAAADDDEDEEDAAPKRSAKRRRIADDEGDAGSGREDDDVAASPPSGSGSKKAASAAAGSGSAKKDAVDEEEEEEDVDWGAVVALDQTSGASSGSASASAGAGSWGSGSFDPVRDCTWKRKRSPSGEDLTPAQWEDVPYSALAKLFEAIESEGSRLKTVSWLSDFLRSVIATRPDQLVSIVYLACNQIAPAYEGKETNVGPMILYNTIANATGGTVAKLKKAMGDTAGDMGELAMQAVSKQTRLGSTAPLTCVGVFKALRKLADVTGKDSGKVKQGIIQGLLTKAQGSEAKFIVRGLEGNLRIGMAEKGVVAALARAVAITPPSLTGTLPPPVLDVRRTVDALAFTALHTRTLNLINQAYTEVPNHQRVIDCILLHGVDELPNKCFLQPGVPVKVMLGKPAVSIRAILDRFKDLLFTMEYKYDGERAQVHLLEDGRIMIYSRNSEDHTPKYPELAISLPNAYNKVLGEVTAALASDAAVDTDETMEERKEGSESTPAATAAAAALFSTPAASASDASSSAASTTSPLIKSFIIDCEVVAWDRAAKKILPFQTLSTRKKKDVTAAEITVQVCLYAFDLLFINGKSYIDQPLQTRRKVLREHFHEVDDQFKFATFKDTSDEDEITDFMNEAVRASCEGLMIKSLLDDATYIPNKRNWIKLKKDYMAGLGDSLDLVVIGAWHGKGKRLGVYGAFLLASYDEDTEEFQSICKVGTGLSDEFLESSAKYFSEHVLSSAPSYFKFVESDVPDVFFDARRIWEIKCADLSLSPHHKAAMGIVHESKGIALRFPRFIREREDKKVPEGITSAKRVAEMYNDQAVQGGAATSSGGGGAGKRGGR